MESFNPVVESNEKDQLEMEKGSMDEQVRNEEANLFALENQLKEAEEALANFQKQHAGEGYSSALDAESNKLKEEVVIAKEYVENCKSRILNGQKARAALGV